jgi:hypothetical protein
MTGFNFLNARVANNGRVFFVEAGALTTVILRRPRTGTMRFTTTDDGADGARCLRIVDGRRTIRLGRDL